MSISSLECVPMEYIPRTHTHIRTRTHVHSVTIARTVIPIPRYRRPESPISNFLQRNPVVHIAAGVTCETLFLLILRDHCFKHRCTSIETINRSRARIRYHNVYKHARIKSSKRTIPIFINISKYASAAEFLFIS